MRKRPINRSGRPHISSDVTYRSIDGEYILLDVKRGLYFGLKGVAADIWEGLSKRKKLEAVRTALLRKYKVEQGRVDRDLRDFVASLRSKGLVL